MNPPTFMNTQTVVRLIHSEMRKFVTHVDDPDARGHLLGAFESWRESGFAARSVERQRAASARGASSVAGSTAYRNEEAARQHEGDVGMAANDGFTEGLLRPAEGGGDAAMALFEPDETET